MLLKAGFLKLKDGAQVFELGGHAGQVRRHLGDAADDDAEQQRMVVQAEDARSEEHTSELQSRCEISYSVFCL